MCGAGKGPGRYIKAGVMKIKGRSGRGEMQGRKYLTSVEVKGDMSVGEFGHTQRKCFSSVWESLDDLSVGGKINKGRNKGRNKGKERSTGGEMRK